MPPRPLSPLTLLALFAGLGLPTCGSEGPAGRDLAVAVDAPRSDAPALREAGPRLEGTHREIAAADRAGLSSSCSGACAQQTLKASFGAVVEPFERAIYGIESAWGGSGPRIYLEALHGGFGGCPTESSPTPDRTLVVSGLPLPVAGAPVTTQQGLVVTLLDYKGTLLPDTPVAKATSASASFVAARVCPACVGQPAPSDPSGFVALDLEASFPGGSVQGHLHAVHCDSLDR